MHLLKLFTCSSIGKSNEIFSSPFVVSCIATNSIFGFALAESRALFGLNSTVIVPSKSSGKRSAIVPNSAPIAFFSMPSMSSLLTLNVPNSLSFPKTTLADKSLNATPAPSTLQLFFISNSWLTVSSEEVTSFHSTGSICMQTSSSTSPPKPILISTGTL